AASSALTSGGALCQRRRRRLEHRLDPRTASECASSRGGGGSMIRTSRFTQAWPRVVAACAMAGVVATRAALASDLEHGDALYAQARLPESLAAYQVAPHAAPG